MLFPADMLYDRLTPILADCAISYARTEIDERVSETAAYFDLSELVMLELNESGSITNVRTDTSYINEIKASFTKDLTKTLKKNTLKIGVPIGDIIGFPSTAGRGPSLPVRITGYSAAIADIQSEFISAGLNQTLHRITMTVTVECTLILPRLKTQKMTQMVNIPLSETVIIGEVPSYYRN